METLTTDDLITVPRPAIQALAEWVYPTFIFARTKAKIPPAHPRWVSHNIHDDLWESLVAERMAFLKEIFWKAEQEAARRERALDPTRDLGYTPPWNRSWSAWRRWMIPIGTSR